MFFVVIDDAIRWRAVFDSDDSNIAPCSIAEKTVLMKPLVLIPVVEKTWWDWSDNLYNKDNDRAWRGAIKKFPAALKGRQYFLFRVYLEMVDKG